MQFKNTFGENIFKNKYALFPGQTWEEKAHDIVEDVTSLALHKDEQDSLYHAICKMQFLPGGRYIYYAGRQARFWNNCYLLKGEEDTREEWGELLNRSTKCLMTGGGIGIDYSVFRAKGAPLRRTGGEASGPIPLMYAVNEIGRTVKQGGSRRSAIYGSLNWQHGDAAALLQAKDWHSIEVVPGATLADAKRLNFDFPAPLDMTNISLNYDDAFLEEVRQRGSSSVEVFIRNIRQAMETGEPGFSFNFGDKQDETLRNACTEVTSADDSDVCNLGSVNMAACDSLEQFKRVVDVASKFLVCGTIGAQLPYEKVYAVREKNRRLGLGLMGVHEWLLQRGYRYECVDELKQWLEVYRTVSEDAANSLCDSLGISRPIAYRAIAPTGTIGILAGTSTGLEPIFETAYQRRYLKSNGWHYEYVIDNTARMMVDQYGLDPESIETASDLAKDIERRIKFQADVQDYVDMSISSTINIPSWGSDNNNESLVESYATIVAKYAPRLRGLTFYPDGSRGGQPLTKVGYKEALQMEGVVYAETDSCIGGVCGI